MLANINDDDTGRKGYIQFGQLKPYIKSLVTIGVHTYLAAIVDCHLWERTLLYDTDDEPKECIDAAGVPQVSVLDALL